MLHEGHWKWSDKLQSTVRRVWQLSAEHLIIVLSVLQFGFRQLNLDVPRVTVCCFWQLMSEHGTLTVEYPEFAGGALPVPLTIECCASAEEC